MTSTWISHWLPFRPSSSVYSRFDFDSLPPVDPSEFDRYKTAEDVRDDPPHLGPNPIFAEWDFELTGMFMSDRSYDIYWSVDKYGRVVIPGGMAHTMVARSLAEFLARMSLENSIWWTVVDNGLEGPARAGGTDPQDLWDMLQNVLSEKQLAYLRPYYDVSKIWYTTVKDSHFVIQ